MASGSTDRGFPTHWQEQAGQFLKIADQWIEQQTSAAPGFIVKKGEDFNYTLRLEFSELLGQIGGPPPGGVEVKIGIFATDLSTGTVASEYSFDINAHSFDLVEDTANHPADSDTQKTWDHLNPEFVFNNANTLGVFLISAVAIVPATGISAFTSGPLLMVFP